MARRRIEWLYALKSRDGKPLGNIFRDKRTGEYGIQYLDLPAMEGIRSLDVAKFIAARMMYADDRIVPMEDVK